MPPVKPDDVFDREVEWADLRQFATGAGRPTQLAVVYGRRRQGKSFLLRRLARATGGFYHQALQESRGPALRRFASDVASHLGLPGATRLDVDDWYAALRLLLESAPDREAPLVVVLDEIGYMLESSPELASPLQRLYDEAPDRRRRRPARRSAIEKQCPEAQRRAARRSRRLSASCGADLACAGRRRDRYDVPSLA